MKLLKLFIMLSLLFSSHLLSGQSLPIDKKTGLLTYTEEITSVASKNELYKRIKNWLSNLSYGKEIYSVLIEEPENGNIILVINTTVSQNIKSAYIWYYNYQMTIRWKENKWKYSISKFFVHCVSTGGFYTMDSKENNTPIEKSNYFDITDIKKMNKNASAIDEQVQLVISTLKQYMNNEVTERDSNW